MMPGIGLEIVAIALSLAFPSILPFTNVPTMRFLVPDGYAGYLATRWDCPGGQPLPRRPFGCWPEITIAVRADGTACVADPIPRPNGFRNAGYFSMCGERVPVTGGALVL